MRHPRANRGWWSRPLTIPYYVGFMLWAIGIMVGVIWGILLMRVLGVCP